MRKLKGFVALTLVMSLMAVLPAVEEAPVKKTQLPQQIPTR